MLPEMPHFWEEYDRGVSTYEQVLSDLAEYNSCDRELAEKNLQRSILTQEEIPATKALIKDLKSAQYKLYVLSNMSLEFIEFLRKRDVYKYFDGEVVSCEEHIIKPDAEIYRRLTSRYGLDVAETLFIDDRQQNVDAARNEGWQGFKFDPRNPEASCNELRDILLKR
jgi:HAD superfamily hydrolase (TIGR01509 family)